LWGTLLNQPINFKKHKGGKTIKRKPTILLATFVFTMGLLLGASTAQAATVNFDPNNSTQATGIDNLDIGGTLYNVVFTATETVAEQIYGPFPGTFDFTNSAAANEAANAVNIELNQAGAQTVGAGGSAGLPFYRIGYDSETVGENIPVVIFWEAAKGDGDLDPWVTNIDPDGDSYNFGKRMWADFTLAGPPADPVTIGGTVTGFEGSGLVLQNNGVDNLLIEGDGGFEFPTPLTPDTFYNVTVATNPTNPAQTCSVANGSGQVPTEDVTDVAVTCAEVVVGDISKVAAEGDTLPDGTVLRQIFLDGGVAIDVDGNVAFGGESDDDIDAAFTQAGKVVAEGDTLPDGTTLSTFRQQGEVAIGSGESASSVAFHGEAEAGFNDIDSVFTQTGVVAQVGDNLPSGTLDQIDDEGKVAVNNFDQVAFHGIVEIEGGLFDENIRAVFTADGQTAQVAARVGDTLDGATVEEINTIGGVAISDFDEVAFHGRVVNPDPDGGDTLKAVFTTDGLAAREASELPDGTTLDDINEDGGVAINLFGDVAFHGSVIIPDTLGDSVKAVLTQEGVIAKEGDTLPDGTIVDEITVQSGVAINLFGDVVFHGRTGDVKAVFTQHGLVAKVGDNLNDGTTLQDINDNGGVAVNPYGFEAAFHGIISAGDPGAGVDAVLVGQAPVANSEETSGE
jgi:hypothetical protein